MDWLAQNEHESDVEVFERILWKGGKTAISEFLSEVKERIRKKACARSMTVQSVVNRMFLCASEKGRREVLIFLLDLKAPDVHISQDTKTDALVLALKGNDKNCVEMLIAAGADVNGRKLVDKPLFIALEGRSQFVQVLLRAGADVNQKDSSGNTALTNAVLLGRNDSVKLLLEAGTDVGQTAFQGSASCVKLLVEAGADYNQRDSSGNTALTNAVHHGNADSVKLLLDAGADMNLANTTEQSNYGWPY